jgi:hypothetical protein
VANSEITNGGGRPVYRIVNENGKRGPICDLCNDPHDSGPEYIRFGSKQETVGLVCANAIAAALTADQK